MNSTHRNRLADETSPYLLQHAHNPVDWYPWGDEAFAKARAEDKPVLLSVGYSACHWCHVMAHESFEDEETAVLMNRDFVNVKVDREERPDVDAIYMSAVQAMTGAGGWPMTVVMTPDGKPFFSGTYFPKEDRFGRPSFKRVLESLTQAWQTRRDEVLASAENITGHLQGMSRLAGGEGEISEEVLTEALDNYVSNYDSRHGGFGGAPKFPPHSALKFLLRRSDAEARSITEGTLHKMAYGGIYDQLGGGFARYSVDELWLVPHFEKMLYDNAQLVRRYSEAYHLGKNLLYKRIVEETLEWVAREMTSPEGGFYSALDADSEGEEGKFYVWDEEELETLLADDARPIKAYWGVSSMGNFEGKNILNVPHEPSSVAQRFKMREEELAAKVERARQTLLAEREKRIRPGLDDKILCSWNGLMLAAYADAGRVFGRQDYIDTAVRNASFIRDKMYQNGRLLHTYKNGEAKINGLLEDYAFYGLGLLALYRATFDAQWLHLALELAQTITTHFRDPEGGFFSTPDDGEKFIVRPKDFFDSAVPSDSGAAAEVLLLLARYTDMRDYEDMAAETVKPILEAMRKQPIGFGTLLCVVDLLLSPPKEIAIVGDKDAADTQALLQTVNATFLPRTMVAVSSGSDDPLAATVPFLQARDRVEGKATAYVCEGGACRLPVTTPEALREQLKPA